METIYFFKDKNHFRTLIKVQSDKILIKNHQIMVNTPEKFIDETGYVDVEVMSVIADKKDEFKSLLLKLRSPDFEEYLIQDMKLQGLTFLRKMTV